MAGLVPMLSAVTAHRGPDVVPVDPSSYVLLQEDDATSRVKQVACWGGARVWSGGSSVDQPV